MKIAEFFINLGIKGDEKTKRSLGETKGALKDIKDMSIEMKAAIVGALYYLEKTFAQSGQMGTNLTNTTALLGGSARILQQYQYAMRQVGVTNEETAGTFEKMQKSMTQTLLTGQAPKGLMLLAQRLNMPITGKNIEEWAKNPEKLLQILQQYALKERSPFLRNEILGSFGLSDSFISGLSRNALRPDVLAKAPTYSDGEIKQLDKANIAWGNLGTQIQMAVGHFNALHGLEIVTDITKITTAVLKLLDAVTKLGDRLGLFNKTGKDGKTRQGFLGETTDRTVGSLAGISGVLSDPSNKDAWKKIFQNSAFGLAGDLLKNASNSVHEYSLTQHFHGQTDPRKAGDAAQKGIEQAHRQMSAGAQGS